MHAEARPAVSSNNTGGGGGGHAHQAVAKYTFKSEVQRRGGVSAWLPVEEIWMLSFGFLSTLCGVFFFKEHIATKSAAFFFSQQVKQFQPSAKKKERGFYLPSLNPKHALCVILRKSALMNFE